MAPTLTPIRGHTLNTEAPKRAQSAPKNATMIKPSAGPLRTTAPNIGSIANGDLHRVEIDRQRRFAEELVRQRAGNHKRKDTKLLPIGEVEARNVVLCEGSATDGTRREVHGARGTRAPEKVLRL